MTKKAAQKQPWDLYGDYLRLDKILGAQTPWSDEAGNPIHDEKLFIVFHQVYELWFKQILFELDDIQDRFAQKTLDDHDLQPVLTNLDRIVKILELLVKQIDILETMAPQNFIDFREYLKTASGFQSFQFRLIETRLGLRRDDRIPVFHGQFDADLSDGSRAQIRKAEERQSLYDQIDAWLARTPFVDKDDYSFLESYQAAVHAMFDEKEKAARDALGGETLEKELLALRRGRDKFEGIFDRDKHAEAQKNGAWRMSWQALQAGLFITIYKTEPALQIPAALLSLIMDVDALLARWRYRHALMVQRMMGFSVGTGGSSGYGYLMDTVEKHRIFADIFALSTYLIPSRLLPALPESVSRDMGYRYASGNK